MTTLLGRPPSSIARTESHIQAWERRKEAEVMPPRWGA